MEAELQKVLDEANAHLQQQLDAHPELTDEQRSLALKVTTKTAELVGTVMKGIEEALNGNPDADMDDIVMAAIGVFSGAIAGVMIGDEYQAEQVRKLEARVAELEQKAAPKPKRSRPQGSVTSVPENGGNANA